jgi:hypothetical protein
VSVYYNPSTISILHRRRRGENSDSGFQPTVAQRKASPSLESPERIGKIGPKAELSDILHKPASEANPVASCLKLKLNVYKFFFLRKTFMRERFKLKNIREELQ